MGQKKEHSIVLMLVVLSVVLDPSGSFTMRETAHHNAELDGYLAFSAWSTRLLSLLLLRSLCQPSCSRGSTSSGLLRSIVSALLLTNYSEAWQLLPTRTVIHGLSMGQEEGMSGTMTCEDRKCSATIDIDERLTLREGHAIKFTLKDEEDGAVVHGDLRVSQSDSIATLSALNIMPHYDLAHLVLLSSDDSKKYERLEEGLADNDEMRSEFKVYNKVRVDLNKSSGGNFMKTWVDEKKMHQLSDKMKCGEWRAGSLKIKQAYSVMPRDGSGYIQWDMNEGSVLNLTVCLKLDGEICDNGVFEQGEVIKFTVGDLKLLLKETVRARPMPRHLLISRYEVRDDGYIILSDWRMNKLAFSATSVWGHPGSVRAACIWWKGSKCPLAVPDGAELFNWNVYEEYKCAPEVQHAIVTTLIISIVAGAVIAGAVTGGLAVAAGCRACTYKSRAFQPSDLDDLMGQYPLMTQYYNHLDYTLPRRAELMKQGDRFYVNPIRWTIHNWEDSTVEMNVIGRSVEISIEDTSGHVSLLTVTSCEIDLGGGLSSCHVKFEYAGGDGELMVYSPDTETVILSPKVEARKGSNEVEIGIMPPRTSGHRPQICVGRRSDSKCSEASEMKYINNPDPVGVNVGTTNDTIDAKAGLDFKAFWDSLDKWWKKLIMIVIWVVSAILLLVLIVIIYRLSVWMWLVASAKRASSEWHDIGKYRYETISGEQSTISVRGRPSHEFADKNAIIKWFSEKREGEIVGLHRNRICDSVKRMVNYFPYNYHNESDEWIPTMPNITDPDYSRHIVHTLDSSEFRVGPFRHVSQLFLQPGAQICNSGLTTGRLIIGDSESKRMSCLGNPIIPFSGTCKSAHHLDNRLIDGTLRHPMCKMEPDMNYPSVLYECQNELMAGNIKSRLTYKYREYMSKESDPKRRVFMYDSIMCEERLSKLREAVYRLSPDAPPKGLSIDRIRRSPLDPIMPNETDLVALGGLPTPCVGYSKTSMNNSDEADTFLKEKSSSMWPVNSLLLEHIDISQPHRVPVPRFRMIYSGDVVVYDEIGEVDAREDVKTAYIMPMMMFPNENCPRCPLIYVFYIKGTELLVGGIDDHVKSIIRSALHVGGSGVELRWTTKDSVIVLEVKCTDCHVVLSDGRKLRFRNNDWLNSGYNKEFGKFTVGRSGPFVIDCICVGYMAYCIKDDNVFKVRTVCSPVTNTEGETIERRVLELGMYSESHIEVTSGNLKLEGDGLIVDRFGGVRFRKSGHSLKGETIQLCNKNGCHYYRLTGEKSRNCSGFINWVNCAREDHKVIFWISFSLPLVFILLILVMMIARCCMRLRIKKKGIDALATVTSVADRVVKDPSMDMRRRRILNGLRR